MSHSLTSFEPSQTRVATHAVLADLAQRHRPGHNSSNESNEPVQLNALGLGCHCERNELAHHESGQDHLALLMHNSPQCLELMCAAFASRVAPVNVNHRYTADELVDTLNYAHATVVAVHSDYADVLTAALPRLPHVKVVIEVADSGETVISSAHDYETLLNAHPTIGASTRLGQRPVSRPHRWHDRSSTGRDVAER